MVVALSLSNSKKGAKGRNKGAQKMQLVFIFALATTLQAAPPSSKAPPSEIPSKPRWNLINPTPSTGQPTERLGTRLGANRFESKRGTKQFNSIFNNINIDIYEELVPEYDTLGLTLDDSLLLDSDKVQTRIEGEGQSSRQYSRLPKDPPGANTAHSYVVDSPAPFDEGKRHLNLNRIL